MFSLLSCNLIFACTSLIFDTTFWLFPLCWEGQSGFESEWPVTLDLHDLKRLQGILTSIYWVSGSMSLPGKAVTLAGESRMYEYPHFGECPQVNLLLKAIVMFLTQKLKFLLQDHLSASLIPISFIGSSWKLSTTRWLRPTSSPATESLIL